MVRRAPRHRTSLVTLSEYHVTCISNRPQDQCPEADFAFGRWVCIVFRVLAGLFGFLGGFVGVWFCLFLWVGHGCGVSAVCSRLGPGLTWGLWLGKVLWAA